MRVLMFGWEFPPYITGGLGTACHGLSTSLSHLVSQITFVLPKIKATVAAGRVELMSARDIPLPTDDGPQSWSENVEMLTVQSSLRPYLTAWEYEEQLRWIVRHRQPGSQPSMVELSGDYGANLFEEVARYALVASRIVLGRQYDVVHAHDWMTFLAGVEAKRLAALPLVVHVHATEFDRSSGGIDQRVFDIERLGMEQADRVIAVSQRTKDICVARYGIAEEKIHVVYNGVVPAPEKRLPEKRRVKHLPGKVCVFLGRITSQKGPEYFLEAAYLVSKKLPNVRFVMAGSGDMMPKLIERMAELRLLDRFHFTGFVNEHQRDMLLSQADLLVMPSVSEPFGISPVEAIQYGVPVIVTKQSGVAEVLRHAIKVDFWDVRRIADGMIKVLSSNAMARQLIEGGRDDLLRVSWDKSAEQVKLIYQEIV